jgi:predicted metal-binding membrane protein
LPVLILSALVAWLALLQNGHNMHASEHPHITGHADAHALLQKGWSWLIMLIAMMAPLLAEPIRHLWVRSLPRRRLMAIFVFVMAYITIWVLAGAVLSMVASQLQILSVHSSLTTPCLALAVVIVWQASPWKQVCLNYCHWSPRLSPFGLAADWDCWRFGMVKGFWCVGSCWALMLLPLAIVYAGLPLMLITSSILLVERWQPARPARWRVPLLYGSRRIRRLTLG